MERWKLFLSSFFHRVFLFIIFARCLITLHNGWKTNENSLHCSSSQMKWNENFSRAFVQLAFAFFAIFSLALSVILIATCYMIMAFVSSKAAHRMCGELFWSGFNCRTVSCSSAQFTLTLIQSAHLSHNNHLNPHRMCIRERMISSELSLSSLLSWESGKSPATATTVVRCRQKISSLPRWLAV